MANDTSGSGISSSLTDLMTSLAVIFLLLFVAQLQYYGQKGKISRNVVLARLQEELKKFTGTVENPVQVDIDPNDPLAVLIIVPEDLLNFAVDKADISANGMRFLRGFIPGLTHAVCGDESIRREISLIVVEGHADSTGPDTRNWPLSQMRSMKVAEEGLKLLAGPEHACFGHFLSASGRGSSEPVRGNDGEEDKPRTRRVVFKVRVRSLEQQRLIGSVEGAGRER